MPKTAVIYESKYGATQKYAAWLAEELNCATFTTKQLTIEQMAGYDTLVFGSGIYSSLLSCVNLIEQARLAYPEKKIIAFGVGASPPEADMIEFVREANFYDFSDSIPFFYCRGAWDKKRLSWWDRLLVYNMKKAMRARHKAYYGSWMILLRLAMRQTHDWTDRGYLQPIIDCVRGEE